jgi:hypothetical protein
MFESTGWLLEEPETSEDNQFDLVMPLIKSKLLKMLT